MFSKKLFLTTQLPKMVISKICETFLEYQPNSWDEELHVFYIEKLRNRIRSNEMRVV